MKATTINVIKQELKNASHVQLIELCLRLSKFKKENKELLTYLLFEANDEEQYIASLKILIDDEFKSINSSHLYFAKKVYEKLFVSLINM